MSHISMSIISMSIISMSTSSYLFITHAHHANVEYITSNHDRAFNHKHHTFCISISASIPSCRGVSRKLAPVFLLASMAVRCFLTSHVSFSWMFFLLMEANLLPCALIAASQIYLELLRFEKTNTNIRRTFSQDFLHLSWIASGNDSRVFTRKSFSLEL
jgi:hypothetical protein